MNRFLNTYIKQVTNIDNVDSYINNLYGPEPIYKASLITGYPGIAISLFAIYKETNNFEYYELCNKYLEKTIELINDTPMYSTSLFEGAFGTIFSLLVCSDSGSNYSNIIKNLLFEYKKISKNEIDRLRTKLKIIIFNSMNLILYLDVLELSHFYYWLLIYFLNYQSY